MASYGIISHSLSFRCCSKNLSILVCLLLATKLDAVDSYQLQNLSYPIGQKSLSALESGTIINGLVVKVLRNNKPAVGELVRFHISHSVGSNAQVETPDVVTDQDGIARATFRVGDKPGEYIVHAYHQAKLEIEPIEIRIKALRKGWIAFLVLGLLGGLALFLYGMDASSEGLQKAAGDKMRAILGKLTNKPVMGVLVGTLTTAAIQSSSATTVMVIGFVSSTLMTLKQAIGVIYGCNIGTTLTVQLIAFNIAEYSPLLIALGFFTSILFGARSQALKFAGQIVFGFGLIFFGMGFMSESMNPLRSVPAFTGLIASLGEKPLLGLLVSAFFTGIIQSSGAAIGISIALATQGILTLKAAIVIAFGANIGTTITALLGSLGSGTDGKRVALVHLLFNVIGVLLFFPFLSLFTQSMKALTDVVEPGNISRAIANAHMFFNFINTVFFLPFTGVMERLVRAIIKDSQQREITFRPQFIQPGDIKSVSLSLEKTRRELLRTWGICSQNLGCLTGIFRPQVPIDTMETAHHQINVLVDAITKYLRDLARLTLTTNEAREAAYYLHIAGNLRHLSSAVLTELLPILKITSKQTEKFSDQQQNDVLFLVDKIIELFEKNRSAFEQKQMALAEEAGLLYKKLKFLIKKIQSQNLEHLLTTTETNSESINRYVEFLDALRTIASDVHQLSKTILENQD